MIKNIRYRSPVKIKKPMTRRKKIILIASIVGGVLLAGGAVWAYFTFFAQPESTSETPTAEPVRHFSPLTGVETSEVNTKRPVTAVMIENSPEARPQSGLKDAGVVFEAVAEGGITRFIALYQEAQPELIGPVRSVRPYYLEWAAAFDPAVAHVGGSDEALQMVRGGDYGVDLDQFFNDGAYWRENGTGRYAPHDMYTDSASLNELETAKGKTTSDFKGWARADGKAIEKPVPTETPATEPAPTFADQINLPVSSGLFGVSYTYDRENNKYLRYQAGAAHADREKGQIAPDTVIAMMVNMSLSYDGLHNLITTEGVGTAYIFQNGTVTTGQWSKAVSSAQIQFADADGNEVLLNRGQAWLSAVPNGNTVTWN
ncbi:MAG: DUF3048 domain-containing protein [Candidatus Nomurabacteria bacterium]|jgi:hypothetical protein|nr:DUF3048 domain-containing protein [Candidatus Nomurabacteria bacterium]